MLSYWERESLIRFDVIIVGSGITGLSAAISLKEKQPLLKVAVLERGILPTGASTRNAGFACIGSAGEIANDLSHTNQAEVLQLVELRLKGLQLLRRRLGDENIRYRENGSFEWIAPNENELLNRVDELNELLRPITGKTTFEILSDERIKQFPFPKQQIHGIVQNHYEGELHTGEMMKHLHQYALMKGVAVFTGCDVDEIMDEKNCRISVKRNHGNERIDFECRKVILCTNAFSKKFFPHADIQPGRGLVLITKPLAHVPFKGIYHFDKGYYYFREIDGRVLFGGGRNEDFETEQTTDFALNETIRSSLMEKLQHLILPNVSFEIDMQWSGIMAFGKNKMPMLQWQSENVFAAVRFGGMGVAIGSMAGEMAAEKIIEKI